MHENAEPDSILCTFGLCATCRDPIETDRLLADPLERLSAVAGAAPARPKELVDTCLCDLAVFRGGPALRDDLTIMAVARS